MKYIYSFLIACIALSFSGCKKILDRPPLTEMNDENAWTSEVNLRLYANKYYPSFFTGYGVGFDYSGAALMGYQFSDDVFLLGNQGNFTRALPNSSIWSRLDTPTASARPPMRVNGGCCGARHLTRR